MAVDLPTRVRAQLELTRRQRIRYQADPAAFAREWLNLDPTPDQVVVMESVRDNSRTFVAAANGVGKTNISSAIVCWFVECFEDSIVLMTAPAYKQVCDLLFREVRARHAAAIRPLRGKLLPKEPRWDVSPQHFAVGRTADSEEGFKGQHAEHLLIVLDEGPGCPEYIYSACQGMLKGRHARLLTIGNPTTTSGSFFDAFHDKSAINSTITIRACTHPNVLSGLDRLGIDWDTFVAAPFAEYSLPDDFIDPIPGAVSLFDLDMLKIELGVGTPGWDVIVDGNFPTAGDKALVSLAWLELCRRGGYVEAKTAMPRRLEVPTGKWAGLDVARFGSDRSVLVRMDGRQVTSIEEWQGYELSHTAGKAIEAVRDGYALTYDEGGLGAAITSYLTEAGLEQGHMVFANNAGSKSDHPEQFPRMRDQLWCDAADLLRAGVVDMSEIPEDMYRKLRGELTAVLYELDSASRRKVESKEALKKRIRRSPDIADALNLALRRPVAVRDVSVVESSEPAIMGGVMTMQF